MFNLSIITIGNELVSGSILDTNSQFLCSELSELGFNIKKVVLVGDYVEDIIAALKIELSKSQVIITTGGLGPTTDDLTRIAIAALAGVKIEVNNQAKEKLIALLAKRGRVANENNLRQIEFPKGAEILNNEIGTADAFITKINNIPIISLPGVPREMKHIFQNQLKPYLEKHFTLQQKPINFSFRAFGLAEATLGELIESFKLPSYIEVAYRPNFPDIIITLKHKADLNNKDRSIELERLAPSLIKHIGEEFIYSRKEKDSLASTIANLLIAKKQTLSLAESCSGGLLADSLISIAGASEFLLSSIVSYSNDAKIRLLGVNPETIKNHGAVSKETAEEMAKGIKEKSGSDFSLAVTGIAGPEGGASTASGTSTASGCTEKPVGTFWIGLATPNLVYSSKHFYPQERNIFRIMTVATALDILRRQLLGLELN